MYGLETAKRESLDFAEDSTSPAFGTLTIYSIVQSFDPP